MYMAMDQYGQTYHGLKYPRRDLLNRLNRKHASKMYINDKNGNAVHVGYIITGLWLDVYTVTPMHGEKTNGTTKISTPSRAESLNST